MTEVFRLETIRLRMRRLTLDDTGLMLAVWNDPAFVRHVGDRGIRTVEQARMAITEGALRLYEEHGYGPYRMALKANDAPIGICGLFRRDGLDDPDIGFAVLPEYCSMGFAYEAAQAVIEHARTDIGLTRLTALVSPDNVASISLIEKLGLLFEEVIRMPGEDNDVSVYAMSLTC